MKAADAIPLFLAACPSFAGPWTRYVADDLFIPDGCYLHMGELARHLLHLERMGQVDEFPAVFAVLEQMLGDEDAEIQNLGVVGLMEGIWFIGSHSDRNPQTMAEHLGPKAREAWAEAEGFFWNEGDEADLSPKMRRWLDDYRHRGRSPTD